MQHALPCISTKEGAIPDIIEDGKTGFVIDKKETKVLAERIQEPANDKEKRLIWGRMDIGNSNRNIPYKS